MILVGVLRHYVVLLLQSPPKKLPRSAIREQRALLRSQVLRATSANSPIPPLFYQSISQYLSQAYKDGTYLKDGPPKQGEAPAAPPNPLTDPGAMDGMMAGMKTQMVMMVPQMVIMGWINFFFQGFVLIKLPFPLTLGFKSMLQRGIETPDMDVRWVSSLSWYFLNFFWLEWVVPAHPRERQLCFKFITRYGVSICGRCRPSAAGADAGLQQTICCRAR